eukprot:GEMP01002088.1.p1 GENE.GEMP01002088.1~~GEMP01002088.1.p1  ORF type:complete len:866 (+),score=263.46 GEMP01002088.1:58-2598(+)
MASDEIIGGLGIPSPRSITSHSKTSKFREMIKQKELEMQKLNERQFVELECEMAKKEEDLEKLNQAFQRLQHDFKYNLQLLDDRDQELRNYDTRFACQKAALEDKEHAIKELQQKLVAADNEYHDSRMEKDAEVRQTLMRLDEVRTTAQKKQEDLEHRLRQQLDDMSDLREEFTRRLAEKDAALNDQHRTFTAKLEDQVRQFDLERTVADEKRQQQIETAESQIQLLMREMSAFDAMKRNTEDELKECHERWLTSEQKLTKLSVEFDALNKEKENESARNAELLQDKKARIDNLTKDLQRARADAKASLERMDEHMQAKVQDSLAAIRVLAEENKEKQRTVHEDTERRLAQVRQLHADDVSRLHSEIQDMKWQLAHKENECEKEIAAMNDRCGREKEIALAVNDEALKKVKEAHGSLEAAWENEKKQLVEKSEHAKIAADHNTKAAMASFCEKLEIATKSKIAQLETEARMQVAEIETLKAHVKAARREEENAKMEVLDLKRRIEDLRNVDSPRRTTKLEALGDDFDPLWSGDFGPPSPPSWGALRETPKARDGEIERIKKQNDDLRAVISRMAADAQKLAPHDNHEVAQLGEKLRRKEEECEELRQRNWHLKQDNDRLAAERTQLMQLSNALRADNLLRHSDARLDREAAHEYEYKIAAIEASIKDLAAQNEGLKPLQHASENRRYAWYDDRLPYSDDRAPCLAVADDTTSVAVQTPTNRKPSASSIMRKSGGEKDRRCSPSVTRGRGEIVERATRRNPWGENASQDEIRSSGEGGIATCGRLGGDGDMKLIGRPISPSERNLQRVTTSERATISQEKTADKLRAIQRRRLAERERVRNWNDFKT